MMLSVPSTLLLLLIACVFTLTHAWLSSLAHPVRRTNIPTTQLYHRKSSSSDEGIGNTLIKRDQVRFLGRGENAVVRPGCVLVAPKHEFHHFYRQSAILIYGMGEAEDGSGDYLIRGLILDHPTPFTLKEMMDNHPQVLENPIGENFLFRGGDKGGQGVILLHSEQDFGRAEIGTSGLYQGGWQDALDLCNAGADAESFKAFFNYCEFSEKELEDLLDSVEDGDAWVSVEVPPEFCLNADFDRGDAWSTLRNMIQQMDVSDQ